MINKIKSWAIAVNYSDGDEDVKYITDFPEHIGITINELLQDYKTIDDQRNDNI